jgi:hypothetical protein
MQMITFGNTALKKIALNWLKQIGNVQIPKKKITGENSKGSL